MASITPVILVLIWQKYFFLFFVMKNYDEYFTAMTLSCPQFTRYYFTESTTDHEIYLVVPRVLQKSYVNENFIWNVEFHNVTHLSSVFSAAKTDI